MSDEKITSLKAPPFSLEAEQSVIGAVLLIVFSAYNAIYKDDENGSATQSKGDNTYILK